MKIKILLTAILTLLTFQFANVQQTENYTALDVVRLVTDANFKLNAICRNRVSGHEHHYRRSSMQQMASFLKFAE